MTAHSASIGIRYERSAAGTICSGELAGRRTYFSAAARASIDAARELAKQQAQPFTTVRMLGALLTEATVLPALASIGAPVMQLLQALDAPEYGEAAEASADADRVDAFSLILMSHAISSGQTVIEPLYILVVLASYPKTLASQLLERCGFDKFALVQYLAHPPQPPTLSTKWQQSQAHRGWRKGVAPGQARIIMHNDKFSTREFVMQLLTEDVGLPGDEATTLMLKVHNEGHASLAVLPTAQAHALVARMTERARSELFPLRFTVVARPG